VLQTVLASLASLMACWYQEKLKRGIFYLTNDGTAVNLSTFTSSDLTLSPSMCSLSYSPSSTTIVNSSSTTSLQFSSSTARVANSTVGLTQPDSTEDKEKAELNYNNNDNTQRHSKRTTSIVIMEARS
jgi:hypothetical protein